MKIFRSQMQVCLKNYKQISHLRPRDAYVDGLVQERCNSSALAMELSPFYTNPSMFRSSSLQHVQVMTVCLLSIKRIVFEIFW